MSGFSNDQGFSIELLQTHHLDTMAELLGAAFSQHEALAHAVGQTHADIANMVRALGAQAVAEQLTIVALNPAGEMLGVMLADDFACPPEQELATVCASFAPIGALLDALDNDYRAGRQILPGQIAHLFMVGVAHHVNGRGLAQVLVRASMTNAGVRGYGIALAEATGAASQHLLGKLGFVPVHQIDYPSFVFGEKTPFAAITEVRGAVLMECANLAGSFST
jgi:ribosomal protein S18 acetylase RimI-like enzyme